MLWILSGFLVLWTLTTPPFQNADESAHYFKACSKILVETHPVRGGFGHSYNWNINELGIQAQTDEVRKNTKSYSWSEFFSPPIHESKSWRFYPHAVPNTIIPYALPQIACKVLRETPIPYQYIFYALRLAFVASFLALAWFARRTNENLFVASAPLLMIPMVINQGAAISADYFSIGASLIFGITIASMVNNRLFPRWGLALAIFLLWNTKIVYAPFTMALLIPLIKWKEYRSLKYLMPTIGLGALAAALQYYYQTSKSYFDRNIEAQQAQMETLLNEPGQVFNMLMHTINNHWEPLLTQSIGMAGWMTTPISPATMWIATLTLLLWIAYGSSSFARSNRWNVALLTLGAASAVISFVGIYLSMYLYWTPPSSATISGVQGRYLLPMLFFLTPLIFSNKNDDSIHLKSLAAYLILAGTTICFLLFDVVPFFY